MIDPTLIRKYGKMQARIADTPEGETARRMCEEWAERHPGLHEAWEEAREAERLRDLLRQAGGHQDDEEDPEEGEHPIEGRPGARGGGGGGLSDVLRSLLFGAGDAVGLQDARRYADLLQMVMDNRDFVEAAFGWGEIGPDEETLEALERSLIFDKIGYDTIKVPVKGKRRKDGKGKRRGKASVKHRKRDVVVVHFTLPEDVWERYLQDGEAEDAVALLQIIEDALADTEEDGAPDYRDLDPGD